MGDVGRAVGVSRTAVSFVLSGSNLAATISPQTRRRILATAHRLGYSRNPTATALKRGYSDSIVLLAVTKDLEDARLRSIVSISKAASDNGLSAMVHLAPAQADAASTLDRIQLLAPYGLLLLWDSADYPSEHVLDLRSQDLPVIDLLPSHDEGIVSVTADRRQGFASLTKHLIKLGHKRIGVILNFTARWKTSNLKLEGYRHALEAAGIGYDKRSVEDVKGYSFDSGYRGMRRLRKRCPDITAVICLNDPCAVGAIAAAGEMGLGVPEDISIAGYGAHKEAELCCPKLTTVAPAFAKIADAAIDTIMKMRGQKDFVPHSISVPLRLRVGESTGPAESRK